MPPPENNDPYPYSFDNQQPPPPHRQTYEEDESVGEAILDEIDEGFNISGKLSGCGWSIVALPLRIIGDIIEGIFD